MTTLKFQAHMGGCYQNESRETGCNWVAHIELVPFVIQWQNERLKSSTPTQPQAHTERQTRQLLFVQQSLDTFVGNEATKLREEYAMVTVLCRYRPMLVWQDIGPFNTRDRYLRGRGRPEPSQTFLRRQKEGIFSRTDYFHKKDYVLDTTENR